MKKLFLLFIGVVFLFADIGVLIKTKGIVKRKAANSIMKRSVHSGYKIKNGDTIYTFDSLAVIQLKDKSIIKLDKYSTISFAKHSIKQSKGRAYYKITHQKVKQLAVITPYTTIGVKGTIFVVSDKKQNNYVALKKGRISLTAQRGEYEIYSIKEKFAKYKQNLMNEFNEYKKQLQKEFVEYKKSFDLSAGKMVVFNGNKVYEKKIDPKIFEYFKNEF